MVGVPYTDEMIAAANADFAAQADPDNGDVDALLERYPGRRRAISTGSRGSANWSADRLSADAGTLVDFSTFEPDASR